MAARLLWQHGFPLCEITHPPKQQQGMRETTKSVKVASFSLQLSSGDGRGGGGKPFFACKVRLAVYSSILQLKATEPSQLLLLLLSTFSTRVLFHASKSPFWMIKFESWFVYFKGIARDKIIVSCNWLGIYSFAVI